MIKIFIDHLINSINIINNFNNETLFQFNRNWLNNEFQIINNIKLVHFISVINKQIHKIMFALWILVFINIFGS
jgi:hypothetical protein